MLMQIVLILFLTNLFFMGGYLRWQGPAATPIFWELQYARILGGKIELTSGAETDFFIEPGQTPYEKANAPLLLKTVDNTNLTSQLIQLLREACRTPGTADNAARLC